MHIGIVETLQRKLERIIPWLFPHVRGAGSCCVPRVFPWNPCLRLFKITLAGKWVPTHWDCSPGPWGGSPCVASPKIDACVDTGPRPRVPSIPVDGFWRACVARPICARMPPNLLGGADT